MCGRAAFAVRQDEAVRVSARANVRARSSSRRDAQRGAAADESAPPMRTMAVDAHSLPSRYNACPGSKAFVIRGVEGEDKHIVPALSSMIFGLVPSFTSTAAPKPDFFKHFNARSETVASKSIFKRLLKANTCIVLALGFYEWKEEGNEKEKIKQPYFVSHERDCIDDVDEKANTQQNSNTSAATERPLMKFAGLWDRWKDKDGNELYTFTLLTRSSENSSISWLHDRVPVILNSEEEEDMWLNLSRDTNMIDRFLANVSESKNLQCYPVTKRINKIAYENGDAMMKAEREILKNTTPIKHFFTMNQLFNVKPSTSRENQKRERNEEDKDDDKSNHNDKKSKTSASLGNQEPAPISPTQQTAPDTKNANRLEDKKTLPTPKKQKQNKFKGTPVKVKDIRSFFL